MEECIWTIGHSNREADEFLQLLKHYEIELLIDIRRFPGSRKWPHFNREALEQLLESSRISYEHMQALGGRRKPDPDSKNIAWKNASFRAYADYTETEEYQSALLDLKRKATEKKCAIMCSEAVWWRCHRAIISDTLAIQGWKVYHILSTQKAQLHPYTSAANVKDGHLSYTGLF